MDRTISHYKILEKLGEGGTGVVYKAHDTKLDRTVALKFLPTDAVGSEASKEGFIQEAQAAARLDHPSICTIYEIDEAQGHTFVAMGYVEGRSLLEIIESGLLDIEEAVKIALQVAEGLSEAHKKGVIHYDIRPGSIMVTPSGQVKIVDFGLAGLSRRTASAEPGLTAGTVAYMSPEQAMEGKVDHRTDIWSLGAVLYEMVTGRPPFTGEYKEAVVYLILSEDPEPMTSTRPDVPVELERVVRKAMAKSQGNRHQSVDEFLLELKSVRNALRPATSGDRAAAKGLEPSIAVLPFANLSDDPEQEYFCDGIAEDITSHLGQVEGLRVVAKTSAFAFKGKLEDIRGIGRKLGVQALVEGSVRKAGERLRITAQLVNVVGGYHVWSERYDRELKDVFAIQDEIAQHIARALKVELTENDKRAVERKRTRDVQAYDFYLRGRRFLYLAQRRSYGYAREMFLRAIEKDPGYALAYAGIADSYSLLFMYQDSDKAHLEKSIEASRKALELNPELAEGHTALGLALSLGKRYEDAEREFEEAIRLNPNVVEAYYFYGRNCYAWGDVERAAQMFEKASLVDPEDFQVPFFLALAYRDTNRAEEAEAVVRRGVQLVERHLELNPDDARAYALGASGLAVLGDGEKSVKWARRALSIDPGNPVTYYVIACVYCALGQVEEALDSLEKSLKTGPIYRDWVEKDTDLDIIRDHPRFKALLKKMR